ncbi:hypothetical protein E0Z10_g8015 [Xylaria hypoxylon]|uniref:Uncharacterized protein n=1 Tax=Xylaria hypoxylon TaxID=37992 RepID=A0A4Z0YWG3_9PEZI|nr:hypothetical protein E0Z10_g8015 [Xylaria hypoxylon]
MSALTAKESLLPVMDEVQTPTIKRFWTRAISCILVPPALAAYFVWTYVTCLRPSEHRRDASSPTPDGRYIWWSWFIIGALGLNVSTYVLAGVEAGMLMTRRFHTLSQDQIAMHKDKSWSKISGWAHEGRMLLRKRSSERSTTSWSWSWGALFILSLLSWAFALSGLTMETQDSFKVGKRPGVEVVGINATNTDRRETFLVLDGAFHDWAQAVEARVPSLGALYSKPDSDSDFNMTTGNILPSDANMAFFLAPQGPVPITGTAWGIMYKYSCKPIHKLSDFRILNRRINSTRQGYLNGTEVGDKVNEGVSLYTRLPSHYFYEVPGLAPATISVLAPVTSWENIAVFAEVGLSGGLESLRETDRGYTSGSYRGMDDEDILEFALWQIGGGSLYDTNTNGPSPVEGTIPELEGEYLLLSDIETPSVPLPAIGAQCISSSAAGTARIDGIGGTFRDFQLEFVIGSTNGGNEESHMYNIPRFGKAVPAMFLPGLRGDRAFDIISYIVDYESLADARPWIPPSDINYKLVPDTGPWKLNMSSPDWKSALFRSAGLPTETPDNLVPGTVWYSRPFTPEDLQYALEEAYKHTALALMYSQQDSPVTAWTQPNLTAAEPWLELVSIDDDGVPALLVLVLLVLWALGCVVLGVIYSFRERWDSYFSVKSLFWYCKRGEHLDLEEVMKH